MDSTLAPGDPAAVDGVADDFDLVSSAMRRAAALLHGLPGSGTGLTAEAVRARSELLAQRLNAVALRHLEAALALRDYSVELRRARTRMSIAEGLEREASQGFAAFATAVHEAQRLHADALRDLDRAADQAMTRIAGVWNEVRDWAGDAMWPVVAVVGAPSGRFRIASGLALASSPLLAAIIAQRIASDLLAPTPAVSRWHDDGALSEAEARRQLAELVPVSAAAIVEGMAWVDRSGSSQKAVVDIARITGPDGDDRWLVTLPSTQDWVLRGGDQPAPNDLDANLAMMVMPPEARTQYERAVVAAMEQAGVTPGDSVMFAGFSQGGIAAARLASTLHGEYAVGGVLAVGSPIGAVPIGRDIPVLSVQHHHDPVHRIDLTDRGDVGGARVTVWDGPGLTGTGPPLHAGLSAAHNAGNYATTTAHHDRDGSLTAMFGDFVVTDQRLAEGWSVTRTQFQFAE
ncbi:MAG: hypothetical protein CVT64_02170 [Actinobacteria bacterium HGW-Actinobacteria-4]|nr:MAG: hypothetical protein CVT64_02170 [Actinobacteria bacterium HGW-Actinobacteria-4]